MSARRSGSSPIRRPRTRCTTWQKPSGAALVVVGSTHTGHAGRVLPGSTGERLIHGAPCSVAVVPKDYRTARRPSRSAASASPTTAPRRPTAAVHAAAEVARAFGAELEVIGVISTRVVRNAGADGRPERGHAAQGHRAHASRRASTRSWPASRSTSRSASVRLTGDPAELLADHSAKLDLLVTGSRGYGPLRAVLVGGVSGRLIRTAQCPVIVVPRGIEAPLTQPVRRRRLDGGLTCPPPRFPVPLRRPHRRTAPGAWRPSSSASLIALVATALLVTGGARSLGPRHAARCRRLVLLALAPLRHAHAGADRGRPAPRRCPRRPRGLGARSRPGSRARPRRRRRAGLRRDRAGGAGRRLPARRQSHRGRGAAHAAGTSGHDRARHARARAPRATPPGRPAASGPGTQTVRWEPESGSWAVVVMNADGSPGVDVDVQLGARAQLGAAARRSRCSRPGSASPPQRSR